MSMPKLLGDEVASLTDRLAQFSEQTQSRGHMEWAEQAASTPLPDPMPAPPPGGFYARNPAAWERKVRVETWLATDEGKAALAARDAAITAAVAKRKAEEFAAQRLRDANTARVPDEVSIRTVALDDDAHETDALRLYREALAWRKANSRKGVGTAPVVRLVAGPPGTGKSCALAWCVTRHAGTAAYVTAATIAATPRNGWSANEEAWQRWLDVDLLAIDEVGCEKGDPTPIAFLLAERYNAGRATLVSGNLSRKDFAARYPDERLGDRLANGQGHAGAPTGLPWFVSVGGQSMRDPANRPKATGTEGT